MALALAVDNTQHRPVIACGRPNQRDWLHEAAPGSAITLCPDDIHVARIEPPDGRAYFLREDGEQEWVP